MPHPGAGVANAFISGTRRSERVRCAIYTRKSSEEGSTRNSIRCRRSVRLDRVGAQRSGPDRFRAGPGDHRSELQHGAIIAQHLGIADTGIHHCRLWALVAENAHDGVQLRAALGELCAERTSAQGCLAQSGTSDKTPTWAISKPS